MIKLRHDKMGLRCFQKRSSPPRLLISFIVILSIYSFATVLFYVDFSSFLTRNANSKFGKLYDNGYSVQSKFLGDVGPGVSSEIWLKRTLNEYKIGAEEKLNRKRRQFITSEPRQTTTPNVVNDNITAANENENVTEGKGEYPPDIFDLEARRKGMTL